MLVKILLFGDDCHCIFPVFPVIFKEVEPPVQSESEEGETVPATDGGLTVSVNAMILSQPFALVTLW